MASLCTCVMCCARRCRPLQALASADVLTEALLDELLDEAAQAAWAARTDRLPETRAQRRHQAPTLETMLLRMEEMEVSGGIAACPMGKATTERSLKSLKGHGWFVLVVSPVRCLTALVRLCLE